MREPQFQVLLRLLKVLRQKSLIKLGDSSSDNFLKHQGEYSAYSTLLQELGKISSSTSKPLIYENDLDDIPAASQ